MIAAILANPAPHQGKIHFLHGPVELDFFEIADRISETFDTKVTYQPIEIEEWRGRLEQIPMPPFLVQHLCAVARDYQRGAFAGTDSIIETLTGKAPMALQSFLQSHGKAFLPELSAEDGLDSE